MFEAIVALCLATADAPCRDVLLPGYEAPDRAECEAALAARPPPLGPLAAMGTPGLPACAPTGAELSVVEIGPGIFVHTGLIAEPDRANAGDVANLGFVIGDESVAVIDTGSARWMGEGVWRAIRARTDKPVSHVILTHPHPDHVFGAAVFAEAGAEVVAHEGLPRALADRRANYRESLATLIGEEHFLGSDIVPVTVLVARRSEIDLGGRVLQLDVWPTAHTVADLTVLDRRTGALFAGDLVFHRHAPALDGSLVGWQEVLDRIAGLGATWVIPGHGGPKLSPDDAFGPMARYLEVLETDTRAAIDEGQRLGDAVGEIGASEAGHWELFGAYNRRNATVAFTELEWD